MSDPARLGPQLSPAERTLLARAREQRATDVVPEAVRERLLARATPTRTWAVNVLLAMAIAGNVASWDDYLRLQLRSRWFPVMYDQNLALKASLADGRMRWYLDSAHQRFYQFSHSLEPRKP